MKRYIYTLLLSLISLGLFAQGETPPSGANFKQLSTSQWYWYTTDASLWHNKGSIYGYHRITKYSEFTAFQATLGTAAFTASTAYRPIAYVPAWSEITSKPTTLAGFGILDAAGAISLTTTGTSGAATYNSSTGVLNIPSYSGGGGSGTVSEASIVSANGFAGTTATNTTTPAHTITTTVTGILKGNGTAMSAATAGTDYLAPSGSAAALTSFPTLNQNTSGNAATVTTNANLTGIVTSVGNATSIADGAITNAKLANFTISGVELGSNLESIIPGSGLSGSSYNGDNSRTWSVDYDLVAAKASPALTGVPTAPTASSGTNTTQLATTAFVTDATTGFIKVSPSTPQTANIYITGSIRGKADDLGPTFPKYTITNAGYSVTQDTATKALYAPRKIRYGGEGSSYHLDIIAPTSITAADSISWPSGVSGIVALQSDITGAGNVPAGGTTGQVLSKIDGTDFNTEWTTPGGGGGAAAAGTLTGATLASGVTASSLTSVGTLVNLTVTNPITGSVTGNAATVTTNANLTGDVTSSGNATTITTLDATKIADGSVTSTEFQYIHTLSSNAQTQLNTKALTQDIQVFTSSGTWTKPAGTTSSSTVKVFAIGGGGAGGSGKKGATSTVRCAGGGGAAGALVNGEFLASSLSGTETVTVGAGGTGGAGQSTNSTNGNAGTAGGTSSFGTKLKAPGGGGGGGGSDVAGSGGVPILTAASPWNFIQLAGGVASVTGGSGAAGAASAYMSPTGGGTGGGITSGNSGGNGANASSITSLISADIAVTGGLAGSASTDPGGNGNSSGAIIYGQSIGTGGGGSKGNTTGNSGAGGNGGPGAGGGSSGAVLDSTGNSGAGGNGGDAWVVVITTF